MALGLVASFFVNLAISAAVTALSSKKQNVRGKQLDDLTVQSQAYGRFIPLIYGSVKVAGNVIWMEGNALDPTRHKKKSGGGIFGGGTTIKWWTYDGTFAVAFAEGEAARITKIFADSNEIYSASANDTPVQVYLRNINSGDRTIHLGTSSDAQDPRILAERADTPAFRNTVYTMFEDIELEPYGNRIPTITAEITSAATGVGATRILEFDSPVQAESVRMDDGLIKIRERLGSSSYYTLMTLSGNTISQTLTPGGAGVTGVAYSPDYAYLPAGNTSLVDSGGATVGEFYLNRVGVASGILGEPMMVDGIIYGLTDTNEIAKWVAFGEQLEPTVSIVSTGAAKNTTFFSYDAADDKYYFSDNVSDHLYEFDPITLTVTNTWDASEFVSGFNFFSIRKGLITYQRATNAHEIERLNSDGTVTSQAGLATTDADQSCFWLTDNLIYGHDGIYFYDSAGADTVTLSSVVSDLCTRSGLSLADIDTSALTDDVSGFVIGSMGSASSALQPLMDAYQFDIVESEYKLVFVPRGGSSIATLTVDDLGAVEGGEQKPPLIVTRAEETDLPKTVNVRYMDVARDFEQNERYATRTTTTGTGVLEFDFPLVLSAFDAARIAEIILFIQWEERIDYEFTLPYKFSKFEIADIITIEYEGVTHIIRLTEITAGNPGMIECKGVADRTEAYNPAITSTDVIDTTPVDDPEPGIQGPAEVIFLDIPLLQDADNSIGFYVAVVGYYDNFYGGSLYTSSNDGATYTQTDFFHASTWGKTTEILADADHTVTDKANTLNVNIIATGRDLTNPTTVTRQEMLDGANLMAIGDTGRWELIRYRDATLEADGTYTLGHLIRGSHGTEHNTGNHAVNDYAVVIDLDYIYFITDSEWNVEKLYGVQGFSGLFAPQNTFIAEAFTNPAEGLVPFAPVDIVGIRDGSLNLDITWKWRGRVAYGWRDGYNVTLWDAPESYEIDIMSTASPQTVLRTLAASSGAVTYTAAQQAVDFGSPLPASVEINIYQLNVTVGRGHNGNKTI